MNSFLTNACRVGFIVGVISMAGFTCERAPTPEIPLEVEEMDVYPMDEEAMDMQPEEMEVVPMDEGMPLDDTLPDEATEPVPMTE